MSFEKVLIVEDEPVVRSLLTEIFTRRKFIASAAETLTQADALLLRESFDLVMLDIRLPDGDGQQFLERLAAMPERPLVVMVTGYGSIESAVACMRAGAFDYVLKPFTPSQIDIIIKKAQSSTITVINSVRSISRFGDIALRHGMRSARIRLDWWLKDLRTKVKATANQ